MVRKMEQRGRDPAYDWRMWVCAAASAACAAWLHSRFLGDVATSAWADPGALDWAGGSALVAPAGFLLVVAVWHLRLQWPPVRARVGLVLALVAAPALSAGVGLANADEANAQREAAAIFERYTADFPRTFFGADASSWAEEQTRDFFVVQCANRANRQARLRYFCLNIWLDAKRGEQVTGGFEWEDTLDTPFGFETRYRCFGDARRESAGQCQK